MLVSQLSVQQQLGRVTICLLITFNELDRRHSENETKSSLSDVCLDGLQLLLLQPLLGAGRIVPQCLYLRLVSQRPLHHRHHRHGLQDRHHDHASGQVGAVREEGEGRK